MDDYNGGQGGLFFIESPDVTLDMASNKLEYFSFEHGNILMVGSQADKVKVTLTDEYYEEFA